MRIACPGYHLIDRAIGPAILFVGIGNAFNVERLQPPKEVRQPLTCCWVQPLRVIRRHQACDHLTLSVVSDDHCQHIRWQLMAILGATLDLLWQLRLH
jgi:hypothetical protein